MRFGERDKAILLAIQKYGGVLARSQIKSLFWPRATERAMHERLSILYENGYIDWPNAEQRKVKPGPKSICWLGVKGIIFIAGQNGVDLEEPATFGENQKRIVRKELRKRGILWLREPNWSKLDHDLRIVDFWLAVEKAVADNPTFALERWISEREFGASPDRIEFRLRGVRQAKKVIPDGYFVIVDKGRQAQGLPFRARFLLELDMASEDTGRFEMEKVAAGMAYIQSAKYKERFGINWGIWLIVTKSQLRLKHLMATTARLGDPEILPFFFTTLEAVQETDPLTSPIWYKVGNPEPQSLLRI